MTVATSSNGSATVRAHDADDTVDELESLTAASRT